MYFSSFLENYFINLLYEEAEHAAKTYREKSIIEIFKQLIKIFLFFCILWYYKLFKI